MQRLRVTFSRGEELKYLSHLDVMRLWERALRRADLPLAYSQGFSPHAKISIAAPLPLGVTGERELMDIVLQFFEEGAWLVEFLPWLQLAGCPIDRIANLNCAITQHSMRPE